MAVHDEEEGDAAEDDMGEAILDDDDDDDNVPLPHPTSPCSLGSRVRGCNHVPPGCNTMCPLAATLCVPRSISSSATHARMRWSPTGATTTTTTTTSEPLAGTACACVGWCLELSFLAVAGYISIPVKTR
jgi:hypothetical protein